MQALRWSPLALTACLGCSGGMAARVTRDAGHSIPPDAAKTEGTLGLYDSGACGCDGGACEDDACVPLAPGVLATGLGRPGPIVLDDRNVYWADLDPPAILKCAKTGCGNAPSILAQGSWSHVTRLVVHGDYLYWGGDSVIYKCSTAGCGSEPAMTPAHGLVRDLAVGPTGGLFVATTSQDFFLARGEVDECSATDCDGGVNVYAGLPPFTPQVAVDQTPDEIAVDGQNLYAVLDAVTVDGVDPPLVACTLGACGSTAHPIFNLDGPTAPVPLLTIDDHHIFVLRTDVARGGVLSIVVLPKDFDQPGTATPSLVDSLSPLAGLAVDETFVYFAEVGMPDSTGVVPVGAGRIGKCAINGCNGAPETLKDYVSAPGGLAVDDANVYWTEQGTDAGAPSGRLVSHAK